MLLNNLNNLVDTYISGKSINNALGVNQTSENISLPNGVSIASKNIPDNKTNNNFLNRLSGLLILYINNIAV